MSDNANMPKEEPDWMAAARAIAKTGTSRASYGARPVAPRVVKAKTPEQTVVRDATGTQKSSRTSGITETAAASNGTVPTTDTTMLKTITASKHQQENDCVTSSQTDNISSQAAPAALAAPAMTATTTMAPSATPTLVTEVVHPIISDKSPPVKPATPEEPVICPWLPKYVPTMHNERKIAMAREAVSLRSDVVDMLHRSLSTSGVWFSAGVGECPALTHEYMDSRYNKNNAGIKGGNGSNDGRSELDDNRTEINLGSDDGEDGDNDSEHDTDAEDAERQPHWRRPHSHLRSQSSSPSQNQSAFMSNATKLNNDTTNVHGRDRQHLNKRRADSLTNPNDRTARSGLDFKGVNNSPHWDASSSQRVGCGHRDVIVAGIALTVPRRLSIPTRASIAVQYLRSECDFDTDTIAIALRTVRQMIEKQRIEGRNKVRVGNDVLYMRATRFPSCITLLRLAGWRRVDTGQPHESLVFRKCSRIREYSLLRALTVEEKQLGEPVNEVATLEALDLMQATQREVLTAMFGGGVVASGPGYGEGTGSVLGSGTFIDGSRPVTAGTWAEHYREQERVRAQIEQLMSNSMANHNNGHGLLGLGHPTTDGVSELQSLLQQRAGSQYSLYRSSSAGTIAMAGALVGPAAGAAVRVAGMPSIGHRSARNSASTGIAGVPSNPALMYGRKSETPMRSSIPKMTQGSTQGLAHPHHAPPSPGWDIGSKAKRLSNSTAAAEHDKSSVGSFGIANPFGDSDDGDAEEDVDPVVEVYEPNDVAARYHSTPPLLEKLIDDGMRANWGTASGPGAVRPSSASTVTTAHSGDDKRGGGSRSGERTGRTGSGANNSRSREGVRTAPNVIKKVERHSGAVDASHSKGAGRQQQREQQWEQQHAQRSPVNTGKSSGGRLGIGLGRTTPRFPQDSIYGPEDTYDSDDDDEGEYAASVSSCDTEELGGALTLAFAETVRALRTIVHNALEYPGHKEYGRVYLYNPRFHRLCGRFPSAIALLEAAGFVKCDAKPVPPPVEEVVDDPWAAILKKRNPMWQDIEFLDTAAITERVVHAMCGAVVEAVLSEQERLEACNARWSKIWIDARPCGVRRPMTQGTITGSALDWAMAHEELVPAEHRKRPKSRAHIGAVGDWQSEWEKMDSRGPLLVLNGRAAESKLNHVRMVLDAAAGMATIPRTLPFFTADTAWAELSSLCSWPVVCGGRRWPNMGVLYHVMKFLPSTSPSNIDALPLNMNGTYISVPSVYDDCDEDAADTMERPPIDTTGMLASQRERALEESKREHEARQRRVRERARARAERDFAANKLRVISELLLSGDAMEAHYIALVNKQYRRADWHDVRVGAMTTSVAALLGSHGPIRALLLLTGETQLIEDSPHPYWGHATDETTGAHGRNMYGEMLMRFRYELRHHLDGDYDFPEVVGVQNAGTLDNPRCLRPPVIEPLKPRVDLEKDDKDVFISQVVSLGANPIGETRPPPRMGLFADLAGLQA